MKRSGWLILLVVLVLLLAANLTFSVWRSRVAREPAEGDNTEANRPTAPVERVKDAAERARMERYIKEYEAPLKIVKSFPGPSGETIDCVDINTQPALQRREMRDHKIQFAPGTLPGERKQERPAGQGTIRQPDQLYLLTGESCPEMTVPIRRLDMATLARFRTLDDFFKKEGGYLQKPCGDDASAGHEYAHASMSVANWGAESILNVWSPYVEQSDEFSLSQIWVVRGSGADRETVEAGWQVYDDLYGDWRAHLFIYFTPDNYGSGGCYNLSCGAFVQTNNTVYIGGGFTNYSVPHGGEQREFKLLLYKDGTNGSWWLRYGDTWVGYWPRTLFDGNGLRDQGSIVDFGGEIVNTQTDGRHTRTDMGSGRWPYEGFAWAAYQRAVRYVDTSNFYQSATGLTESRTNDRCYDIDLTNSGGDWETYFYFGGSGYNSQCP